MGAERGVDRRHGARVLVVDNYDSFVYNLVQYLGELGAEPVVHRHDAVTLDEMDAARARRRAHLARARPADRCGPVERGDPRTSASAACRCSACASACSASASSTAAAVVRAPHVMHGKTSEIRHTNTGVFAGLPNPLTATRYHSLVVARDSVPDVLEITAESDDESGDGPAPPRVPHRGRAVPPRVDPHRRGPRAPAQLPRAACGPRARRRVISASPSRTSDVERFLVERSSTPTVAGAQLRHHGCRGAAGTSPRSAAWR